MRHDIPKPWQGFLTDLDQSLPNEVRLHCLGGFVVAMSYGLARPTADVDVLAVIPHDALDMLLRCAGPGTPLHTKYGVYLQLVPVAHYPEDYAKRLREMFAGAFRRLRLFALDPYDLALTKLERNSQRDRDDVFYLAEIVPLDLAVLRARYQEEMRPYLPNQQREDLRLQLWIDVIEERRAPRP